MYKEYLVQRDTIDQLQAEKHAAEDSTQKDFELGELRSQLGEAAAAQVETADEFRVLGEAHRYLLGLHDGLNADYSKLLDEFDALRAETEQAATDLMQAKDELASLRTDLATSTEKSAALEIANRELTASRQALEAELTSTAARCDALETELGSMLAEKAITEATAECMKELNLTQIMATASVEEHDESWGAWSDDALVSTPKKSMESSTKDGEQSSPRTFAATQNVKVQQALEKLQTLVNEDVIQSIPEGKPQMLPLITISESPLAVRHRRPLTYAVSVMTTPAKTQAPATPSTPIAPPLITVENSPRPTPTRQLHWGVAGSPHAVTERGVGTSPLASPAGAPPLITVEEVSRSSPLAKWTWGVLATPTGEGPRAVAHCGIGTSPLATSDSTANPMTPAAVESISTGPMTPTAQADVAVSPVPMPTLSNTAVGTSPAPLEVEVVIDEDVGPEALRQQLQSLAISNELLREDHRSHEEQLSAQSTKLVTLQEELSFTSTLLSQAIAERDTSIEALRALESDSADTKRAQASSLQERAESAQLILGLQSRANQAAVQIASLKRYTSELEATLAETEAVDTIRESATAATKQVEELTTQLQAVEVEWQKKLDQQQGINRNLQSDLALVYAKNKRELARLEEQYRHEDYKARYESLLARSTDLESRVASMDACRSQLQRTAEDQKKTSEALEIAARTMSAKHYELVNAQKSLERKEEEIELQVRAAKDSVEVLQSRVAELETEMTLIPQLRLEKDEMEAKLNSLTFDLENATNRYSSIAEGTYSSLLIRCSRKLCLPYSLSEIPEIQAEKDALAATIEGLQQQLAERSSVSDQAHFELQSTVEAQKGQLEDAMAQLEAKNMQYNELSEFMEEERLVRTEVIEQLERDVEATSARADAADAALRECEARVAAAQQNAESVAEESTRQIAELRAAMVENNASIEAEVAARVSQEVEAKSAIHCSEMEALRHELRSAKLTTEQLSGELCEKELALHEVLEEKREAEAVATAATDLKNQLEQAQRSHQTFKAVSKEKVYGLPGASIVLTTVSPTFLFRSKP